jgi:hypothetical protein
MDVLTWNLLFVGENSPRCSYLSSPRFLLRFPLALPCLWLQDIPMPLSTLTPSFIPMLVVFRCVDKFLSQSRWSRRSTPRRWSFRTRTTRRGRQPRVADVGVAEGVRNKCWSGECPVSLRSCDTCPAPPCTCLAHHRHREESGKISERQCLGSTWLLRYARVLLGGHHKCNHRI